MQDRVKQNIILPSFIERLSQSLSSRTLLNSSSGQLSGFLYRKFYYKLVLPLQDFIYLLELLQLDTLSGVLYLLVNRIVPFIVLYYLPCSIDQSNLQDLLVVFRFEPFLANEILDTRVLLSLVYLAVDNLLDFLVLVSIYINQFQYRRFPSKGVRSLLQFIELYNRDNRVYSLSQQEVQLVSQIVYLVYYLEGSSMLQ